MPFETGPHVQVACFCETALQDQTNSLSLIRIIDRVTRTVQAPSPPDEMPAFHQRMMMVIMLKSDQARGRHTLTVVPELPSGLRADTMFEATVHFGGDASGGQNLVIEVNFEFTLEGVYLFKVFLDDEFLTALPFHVQYNRVATR